MDSPTFKSSQGVYYTKQLFWELSDSPDLCIYTLKQYDLKKGDVTYPSIHRAFVEESDLSEYEFALKYFDSWAHFKKLLGTTWFKEMLAEAREEKELKLAAQNLNEIRKKARSGDLQANKYLLEKSWLPKDDVGRPSKQKIKDEANRLFDISEEIASDLKRLAS